MVQIHSPRPFLFDCSHVISGFPIAGLRMVFGRPKGTSSTGTNRRQAAPVYPNAPFIRNSRSLINAREPLLSGNSLFDVVFFVKDGDHR